MTVAVGDWVLVRESAVVGALPRRTAIVRRSAGVDARAQTLAANVDTVLVLVAADGRVTPRERRALRHAGLGERRRPGGRAHQGRPRVGATTSTTPSSGSSRLASVSTCMSSVPRPAPGSTTSGRYFARGRTVALLGSSGAGKSTLANHLTGAGLATGAVREGDRRGRHTTTHRELVVLPGGGVLIDSPGLREVGLWQGEGDGIARTFPEITALLDQCRFADCTHRREPGCAVQAAVEDGQDQRGAPGQLAQAPPGARPAGRPRRPRPAAAAPHRATAAVTGRYAQARKQWRRQAHDEGARRHRAW